MLYVFFCKFAEEGRGIENLQITKFLYSLRKRCKFEISSSNGIEETKSNLQYELLYSTNLYGRTDTTYFYSARRPVLHGCCHSSLCLFQSGHYTQFSHFQWVQGKQINKL